MTVKEKYFDELHQFETSELFLTISTDELNKEIEHNCLRLSITLQIAKQISKDDLIHFLDRVKINRRQQLQQSNLEVGLIYYLWFDEQAGQLRFNFINSNHHKLPFTSKIVFAKNEAEVVEDFLKSNYLDGIPSSEFDSVSVPEQSGNSTKVFKQIIYANE